MRQDAMNKTVTVRCKAWFGGEVVFEFEATPPQFYNSTMTPEQYHAWLRQEATRHLTITAAEVETEAVERLQAAERGGQADAGT